MLTLKYKKAAIDDLKLLAETRIEGMLFASRIKGQVNLY